MVGDFLRAVLTFFFWDSTKVFCVWNSVFLGWLLTFGRDEARTWEADTLFIAFLYAIIADIILLPDWGAESTFWVFGIDKSLASTFDKFFFLAASSAAKLIGAEDLAEVLTVLTTGGGVVVEV